MKPVSRLHLFGPVVIILLAIPGPGHGGVAAGEATVDYTRDIRSILSNTCYACHGPDEKKRKTELRLDRRESATAVLDSGTAAIVPGESARSELYLRIVSAEESFRMPPVESGKSLSASEIAILKQWIDDGATWQEHWAFRKPERPEIPAVRQPGAVAVNPIDSFVLDRLDRASLPQSPEADRTTLIRRLTLDLTGLPQANEGDILWQALAFAAASLDDKVVELPTAS